MFNLKNIRPIHLLKIIVGYKNIPLSKLHLQDGGQWLKVFDLISLMVVKWLPIEALQCIS